MNFSALLYAPIYATFGTTATLVPNRPAATGHAVTVIERTSSAEASQEFELGTVRPGVFIRMRELADAGVAVADLAGGRLTYDARSWRIEAHAPRPGPDGEASGEVLLFLSEERDA